MNQAEPQCSHCNVPMQRGFLSDSADAGYIVQAQWIEGEPENTKFLGMNAGLKVKGKQTFHLMGYRCPACSRVELFAVDQEQAKDILLRPAGKGDEQNAEELLRGSQDPDQV